MARRKTSWPELTSGTTREAGRRLALPARRVDRELQSSGSHPSPKKMSHCDVKKWLRSEGVDFDKNFFTLPSSEVVLVVEGAKKAGYRKSKYAPGSTSRMYYQLLSRTKGC